MTWTVFNFDCGEVKRRQALLEWFDDAHVFEVGDEESTAWVDVRYGDDEIAQGEVGWVDEYCYVTFPRETPPLLEMTTPFWDRAVESVFSDSAGMCREADLYEQEDDEPVRRERYEGDPKTGGVGVMYVFAMRHQFRFRAYTSRPPGQMRVAHPSAFDAPRDSDPSGEVIRGLAEQTGVKPTVAGLAFSVSDPEIPDEERIDSPGLRQKLRWAWQIHVEWPLRERGIGPYGEDEEEEDTGPSSLEEQIQTSRD